MLLGRHAAVDGRTAFCITIVEAATSLLPHRRVPFPSPDLIPFSAVWSTISSSAALRNLLALAHKMAREGDPSFFVAEH